MKNYSGLYKNELLNHVIPFWEKYSPDSVSGGFFSCLNHDGSIYDTDKFTWLLGRQTWMFGMLYEEVEQRKNWLEMAESGALFMEKYGRNANGDWYFSFTQKGQPLIQPYNIFSDCYVVLAFARLYRIKAIEKYRNIAMETFDRILIRKENPKGIYSKQVSETRPTIGFSLSMMMCNLFLEMENLYDVQRIELQISRTISEIMGLFYDERTGLIFENVDPKGKLIESSEGRLLNPGHVMEAMWFIMDIGKRRNDIELIGKAKSIILTMLEKCWDPVYDGIFYLLDVRGYPSSHLEWDQKLWWVHIETLVALCKAFCYTKDDRCRVWFERIHQYTWDHFKDPGYGEWYGYLNRRGEILLSSKGGKWKGCFHLPRGLYEVWKTLESNQ